MNKARAIALGLAIVLGWEGFSSLPYRDIVGVWTQGYGETAGVTADSPPVTERQARATAERRLVRDFATPIDRCLKAPTTDTQYAAYLSLSYNIGVSAFCGSTLVRYHNQGYSFAACAQIKRWNRAGGRVVQGLVNRRADEYATCIKDL